MGWIGSKERAKAEEMERNVRWTDKAAFALAVRKPMYDALDKTDPELGALIGRLQSVE